MALTICANCNKSTFENKPCRYCGKNPDELTATGLLLIMSEISKSVKTSSEKKLDSRRNS